FFVQTNHTRKELLFLMFKEINLRNHSSLHKLFYSLDDYPISPLFFDQLRLFSLLLNLFFNLYIMKAHLLLIIFSAKLLDRLVLEKSNNK
ncbi:hypothetical protein CYJ83_10655, partial [Lactobacillus crispatus]